MKYLIAAFLAIHGIAHLVGFLVSWKLMQSPEMPYRTTIVQGALDLGAGGIRVYGAIWLILAIGFASSAAALLLSAPFWQRMAIVLAALSLAMCAAGWPDTRFGLMVNLAILGVASAGARLLPESAILK